jgi:hypothetical protein
VQGDAAPLKSFGENSFYGKTSENPYTILHAYMSSAPRPDVQNGAMVSLGVTTASRAFLERLLCHAKPLLEAGSEQFHEGGPTD